jgi:hypothetical protein
VYFGLAVAFVLFRSNVAESPLEKSHYTSDLFSSIGTMFLFCFWPSFNAGTASGEERLPTVTNTYISICPSWTALRSLRSLPRLQSFRVVLYELHMSGDHPSCQTIAETAIQVVDFAFSFRRCGYFADTDLHTAFQRCCSFIEELRRKMLILSGDEKPQCSTGKDGCGLIV